MNKMLKSPEKQRWRKETIPTKIKRYTSVGTRLDISVFEFLRSRAKSGKMKSRCADVLDGRRVKLLCVALFLTAAAREELMRLGDCSTKLDALQLEGMRNCQSQGKRLV